MCPCLQVAVGGVDTQVTDGTTYEILYSVVDKAGNVKGGQRVVVVRDRTAPVITLQGTHTYELEAMTSYTEPGYTAKDSLDGDLTKQVTVTGPLVVGEFGTAVISLGALARLPPGSRATLEYSVQDRASNRARVQVRHVAVIDTTAPTLTLQGDMPASGC